jgi:type IX secretion system substrate protein/receptor L domain-containing protein
MTEMKKLILLTLLAFVIQNEVSSQSCLPNGISFYSQSQIDNFQSNYPGCTKIEGFVRIESQTITNLNGLSSLNHIGENLFINGNKMLRNLSGLENLDSIGEWLSICFGVGGYGNLSLQNIHGLGNLQYVGKGIRIGHNDSLIDLTGLENIDTANIQVRIDENASLVSLKGLDNLTNIDGDLQIEWNNSLTTLTNLSNLSSISGRFYVSYNDKLTSLEGLENIDSESISEIWIMGNDSLSYCEISSICGYLADSNNNIAGIWENSSGCNSRVEVENACLVGYSRISDYDDDITIYPNPAKNEIAVLNKSNQKIIKIAIFNLHGQPVINVKQINNKIDISTLDQGLYVMELETTERKIRKKLVIE